MEIIKNEKIPYFLTVLLAIIALQFNYVIDNVFKIPIIQYEFSNIGTSKDENLFEKKLKIQNISTDQTILNLEIELRYKSSLEKRLTSPEIDPIPPASIVIDDPVCIRDKILIYKIPAIHPGLIYELTFFDEDRELHPSVFFEANQPMKLIRKSFYTWVLRNKVTINFLLMLMFIILSIVYILKISKA